MRTAQKTVFRKGKKMRLRKFAAQLVLAGMVGMVGAQPLTRVSAAENPSVVAESTDGAMTKVGTAEGIQGAGNLADQEKDSASVASKEKEKDLVSAGSRADTAESAWTDGITVRRGEAELRETMDNKELDAFLRTSMNDENAVGMSAVLASSEAVVYKSYGYADRDGEISAAPDTLYEIGSTTKAFTALAALILQEDGVISLDDTVSKYIPWLNLTYQGKPTEVTLMQLINHTGGIPDNPFYSRVPAGTAHSLREQTIRLLQDAELDFAPGSHLEYSNLGYDILGYVIELASGQEFETYVAEQILIPLGMTHSTMYFDKAKESGKLARGYMSYFGKAVKYDAPVYVGSVPDGYLMTTAEDMGKWLRAQLGGEGVPERLANLIKISHEIDYEQCLVYEESPTKGTGYYSYGWIIYPETGELSHSGLNITFCSDVILYPEENLAVCTMSNTPQIHVMEAAEAIIRQCAGRKLPLLSGGFYATLDEVGYIGTYILIVITVGLLLFTRIRKRKTGGRVQPVGKWSNIINGALALLFTTCAVLLSQLPKIMFGVNLRSMWICQPKTIAIFLVTGTVFCAWMAIWSFMRLRPRDVTLTDKSKKRLFSK